MARSSQLGTCQNSRTADPADEERTAPGVAWSIELQMGIEVCRAAVAAHPGVARLQFQLGRSLVSHPNSAEEKEGVSWLRKAADQDYAAAKWLLGFCYQKGRGVSQNTTSWAGESPETTLARRPTAGPGRDWFELLFMGTSRCSHHAGKWSRYGRELPECIQRA